MHQDLWRVQLGNGEVREMSLDALDAAFDQGTLNEHTPVLAPGASSWERLGKVAGLDEEEVAPNSAMTPSLSPMAIGSFPPPPRIPQDLALDLELLDENALKPRRRAPKIIAGVVAVAAIAAGVFFVAKVKVPAQTAGMDLKPTTAVAAQPPPAPTNLAPDPNEKKSAAPQLSDDMKKKLAEADKAREEKAKAKAADRARSTLPSKPSAPKGKAPKGSDNKYDPLNGNL